MPNKKIKHIIAKILGSTTEETLDIYDENAIHTANVANNLTTTAAGYVLDARQGKALTDIIDRIGIRFQSTTVVNATVPANTDTTVCEITDLPATNFVLCGQVRIQNTGATVFGNQSVKFNDSTMVCVATANTRFGYISMTCLGGVGVSNTKASYCLNMETGVTVLSAKFTAFRLK